LGPDPTPKEVSIWGYFLDFSLNPKLDPFFGHTNPIFDPEGPPQPDFEPGGPLDLNQPYGVVLCYVKLVF